MPKQSLITKHLIFCSSIILLYATYSLVLDKYYFRIDHGEDYGIISSFLYYLFHISIMYFPYWIIISVFYNWVAFFGFDNLPYKTIIRLIFGTLIGFIIGLAFRNVEGSFYIGSLRPQRNIILFTFMVFSAEILRFFAINYFKKNDTT